MKKIFLIIILVSLLFPLTSLAGGSYYAIIDGERIEQDFDGLVPCGGPYENPCQPCHLFVMLDTIIDFVLIYLVFPVATLLLVISGGMLLLSAGDPGKITQGRTILSSTVIGLVIIFSAWLLINLFFSVIGISQWAGGREWFTVNCPIVVREPIVDPIDPPIVKPPPPVDPLTDRIVIFMTTTARQGNFAEGYRWKANRWCRAEKPNNLGQCENITAFVSFPRALGGDIATMHERLWFSGKVREPIFPDNLPIYWWHPTDGARGPLASNWDDMLDRDEHEYPDRNIKMSQYDGTGNYKSVWTGSYSDGRHDGPACGNWSRNWERMAERAGRGKEINTAWLQYFGLHPHHNCAMSLPIRCVCLKLYDPEPPPIPPEGRTIVFVTEGEHQGNFSILDPEGNDGRKGADAFCRQEANIPDNLRELEGFNSGNIKAFISVNEGDEIRDMSNVDIDYDDRVGPFNHHQPIYWWHPHLGARRRVANNWGDMLNHSIIRSQQVGTLDDRSVWTGSTGSGEALPHNLTCKGWTTNDKPLGWKGKADAIDNDWLYFFPNECINEYPIRCIYLVEK